MLSFIAEHWLALLVTAVGGYLLGSVNWAIIVTRAIFRKDIRDEGSGNAGATNVLRNHGRGPAILTALGDVGKSMVAVLVGGWLLTHLQVGAPTLSGYREWAQANLSLIGGYVGGLFCLLGHDFPVFYGFRGGKGVLTTLGMFLMLDWRVALISVGIFALVTGLSRMVSLGSMIAIGCGVGFVFMFTCYWDPFAADPVPFAVFSTAMAALVWLLVVWQHRGNILRICKGTENKLGKRTER